MKYFSKFLKTVLVAALFTLIACNQDWSVNSSDSKAADSRVTILKLKPENSLEKSFQMKAWITENGGSIWSGDAQNGFSGLVFPQAAVSSGTVVFMSWESENLLQADFYPEGIQFNAPVYIRLSYKGADLTGINENDLAIYYYNPVTEEWDLVSNNVNTEGDYVEGYINHFSRYAIGME